MALTFADTHNMIAYLTKSDASEGFNQIIDFLNVSSLKYSLTVNPNIYVFVIKQFWSSVAVKKVNDVSRLQALVDKKKCMSAKRTSWNEFSSSMASAVICLSTGATSATDYEFLLLLMNHLYHYLHHLLNHHHHHKIYLPLPKVRNLEQDKIAQALEITKLKHRVKKLERRNKASKLKRLKKVDTAQGVETPDDTVMDDVSKQGKRIVDMDVTLKDNTKDVALDAEIEESADVQGRQAESQAQIYQINLEHADKKLLIRDPEETATPSAIIHSEAKSKDKGKEILVEEPKPLKKQSQIKQDEAYARELEAELNKNIDWDEMDYFKGMTYDGIHPVFEKMFNSNVVFLLKTKEQMDAEDSRVLKRISESQEDKAAKKQKLDEEVEELRKHLMIVPNKDDDVYTKATPLALKVPIVDYEIYTKNNKPYYKIKRADGSHQLYLSFLSMLRNFDREDLDVLWKLVKERFSSIKPRNFLNDFLLTTLGAMFEKPDIQAQI
nr:hypothetical protein [Tanacetum cinerariifolium]